MRFVKAGLAVLFMASAAIVMPSVGDMGSAEAKGKKDRPGKCGTMKYYSKKTKKCVSAVR